LLIIRLLPNSSQRSIDANVMYNINIENIFQYFKDLTAIGITKPANRRILKAEIQKLSIADGIPNFKPVSHEYLISVCIKYSSMSANHCFYRILYWSG
jgi:hypothetical protein